MTNRIPDYLKLHIEESPQAELGREIPEFERLCALFPDVTGLQLSIDRQRDHSQLTFAWNQPPAIHYRVALEPSPTERKTSLESRRELETALGTLCNRFAQMRQSLHHREAELAAAVPIVSVEEDGEHLVERLRAVLQAAVDTLQCAKAGLYMLDESTTSLKLRAHVGLTDESLLSPPRRLEDSIADIEAMAGHAVVIEDCQSSSHWRVPETSASAICVPVCSATTILGTLWLYRDFCRDFSATEQNLAEIIAGRLAADLERAVLVQEVRNLRARKLTTARSAPAQESHVAKVAPVLEGWEIADATGQPKQPTGFTHWHLAAEDRLHLAVGAVDGPSPPLHATIGLQSAHAAHTQHDPEIHELFRRTNDSIWSGSSEPRRASLFHGRLDPESGSLQYAMAGGVYAYVLRPHGWEPLLAGAAKLGSDEELRPEVHRQVVMPGDVLLAMNGLSAERNIEQNEVMNQIAEKLLRNTHLPARELAAAAVELLETKWGRKLDTSLAVIVAKRAEEKPQTPRINGG